MYFQIYVAFMQEYLPQFLFILKGAIDWQKYVACARAFSWTYLILAFSLLLVYPYLSQENFDAVRRGPQDVGAGSEDIRGPSMYIATAYDFGCKTWTHDSPSHQVIDSFLYLHTDQLLFSFHCNVAHTMNHVHFCDLQKISMQVLKRLVAYARSSAALLVELIKGDKDDRQWLVWFLKH